MKLKQIYIRSGIVVVMICAVLICGLSIPAASAQGGESLDYGHPILDNNQELSAVDLYQRLISTSMTEGERLYWSESEMSLRYNSFIPDNRIQTNYKRENGILTVTMPPYTYTANNGAFVTWIPTRVEIRGKSYVPVETEEAFELCVENLWSSDDFTIDVYYVWEVEISAEVIEELHNQAYETGVSAREAVREYSERLEAYTEQLAEYDAWVSYQQWEEDYAEYCAEMAIYSIAKDAYDTYIKEYEIYAKELDAYNQWQYYFNQMELYKTNAKPYAAYQNYNKKYSEAVQKLAVMESIFIREPRGWQMYGDIMGNAVTTVLANQDMLVAGGCNADDIALAGRSTENLRVLLKAYADLRKAEYSSEHQKYKALYDYYTEHFDELKLNFCNLYKTLKGLYDGNPLVQNFISQKGKAEHYRQLVGHLYIVSTCLDPDGYRSNNWSIAGRTLMQVIDEVHFFPDGDWNPALTVFPETEVAKVEKVERPVQPTVEQPYVEPTAPLFAANPGEAPAFVANPYDTPEPPEASHPGKAPQKPDLDSASMLLMNEVQDGVLKKYTGAVESQTLQLQASCHRLVSIDNLHVVSFYRFDGSLLYQKVLQAGESVSHPVPSRASTAQYIYTPREWGTPDGSSFDLSCVTEDLTIYPLYDKTIQYYTVTWIVDGVSYSATLPYGAMPVPEDHIPTQSWDTPYYRCEFSGWDHKVTPVTGDVTYIGSTTLVPKKFTVTWCIKDQVITEEWPYGETPVYAGELTVPPDQYVYSFMDWDKPIESVRGDVTYTANLSKIPLAIGGADTVLMVDHGDTMITVLATEESVDAREAAVLAQREGKELLIAWEAGVSVAMDQNVLASYLSSACSRMVLQSEQDGRATLHRLAFFDSRGQEMSDMAFGVQVILTRYPDSNSELLFEVQTKDGWDTPNTEELMVNGSLNLRSHLYYRIKPTVSDLCNVFNLVKSAMPGDTVRLDIPCIYGYEVTGATFVTASGEEIVVQETSFVMPPEAVTITLTIEKILYRVRFMVDGEVWSYAEYELGETILLPEIPSKTPTEEYMYTFVGWGDVPVTADGDQRDLIYVARFSYSKSNIDYNTGNNNNVLLEIVLPCVGGGILLFVGGFLAWRYWRKKRKSELND